MTTNRPVSGDPLMSSNLISLIAIAALVIAILALVLVLIGH